MKVNFSLLIWSHDLFEKRAAMICFSIILMYLWFGYKVPVKIKLSLLSRKAILPEVGRQGTHPNLCATGG